LVRSEDEAAAEEAGPLRTCVATRSVRPVDEMLRFVSGPDGVLVPDLKRKLPGRGVWVTATAATVEVAARRKAFARALKRPSGDVTVSATLAQDVEQLLQRDALQALAMANKAGAVVVGSAKVAAAIETGRMAALVHAAEAGEDGVRKLDQVVHRRLGEAAAGIATIKLFAGEQLDLALGRTNVIHAALARGGACEGFLARCQRLDFYRSGNPSRLAEIRQRTERGAATAASAGAAMNGQSPGT
jgi:predicted RNA-binding protein YlxR (DUF448 family)